MCEAHQALGFGWRGWAPLPSAQDVVPKGAWRDLTHPLSVETPRASVFPEPSFQRIRSLPADPNNVTEMRMVVHIGTHVDSPRHFFLDGPACEGIPLDRLAGPGVVLAFQKGADDAISAQDLEAHARLVEPGDIVAIATGWARFAGTPQYHEHPHLSADAAHWLLEHGVKLAAFDVPTPDLPVGRRAPGYDFPVHRTLLSRGVLIAENVAGLDEFAGRRVEFAFLALNIRDSDGAPARVLARLIETNGTR